MLSRFGILIWVCSWFKNVFDFNQGFFFICLAVLLLHIFLITCTTRIIFVLPVQGKKRCGLTLLIKFQTVTKRIFHLNLIPAAWHLRSANYFSKEVNSQSPVSILKMNLHGIHILLNVVLKDFTLFWIFGTSLYCQIWQGIKFA